MPENIQRVIEHAEETGKKLINQQTGHYLACNQEVNVSFWVEYAVTEEGYRIYNSYSHRMEIGGKSEAQDPLPGATISSQWQCAPCEQSLQAEPTVIHYLKQQFPVEMLKCPACGLVLVTEELALGKMAEVEQLLEDK